MSEIWLMKTFNKVKTACKIPQLTKGSFYFNGEYLNPASKTWTEFLALTPADVRDQASVYVYDKQCLFIWNALAVRWFHIGGSLFFDTYAQAFAQVPAASWPRLKFFCLNVAGGSLELENRNGRVRPSGGSGYLLNEVNGTEAAPIKYLGDNSGVLPQLFTLNNPNLPGGLVQAGDILWYHFDLQRHGTGAMTPVLCIGTSASGLSDAAIWTNSIATTDLANIAGFCKVLVGTNTSASTNSTAGLQQTGSGGAGTRLTITANLNFAADQVLKFGLSVKGTNTDQLDLLQLSCLWVAV